jgi:hypothetical protein
VLPPLRFGIARARTSLVNQRYDRDAMSTAIKCKRCGKMIVRNVKGEWQLPKSVVPTTKCTDGKPHEPDKGPGNDQSGLVMGVAIGASIYDAGII